MLYFIVTTCVYDNCSIRQNQYITGITTLKNMLTDKCKEPYKIIIVENNGIRKTYLDSLGCIVYYTNNNSIITNNKGIKELNDVFNCIKHFDIKDSDFIVKMTGRYILKDDSEFMSIVNNIHNTMYDCVIKYGWYMEPVNFKTDNCITGLIGMRCEYVRQIEMPTELVCVETNWGKTTYLIPDEKIYMVDKLGIFICPASNYYFFV